MRNEDLKLTNKELETKVKNALESGDKDEQVKALTEVMQYVAQEATLEVTKTMRETNNDNMIMTSRGAKVLTAEERKYYTKLAEAMKANQSLTDVDITMPTTVIDRIFEELEDKHPLLSKINFQNVTGMVEIIVRTGDVTPAWWGKLTDEIKKELESGFEKKQVNLYKLSAFLPICKSHLDLGPAWLDSFIRRFIVEALSIGLEEGIATGDGKDGPIGMNRDLDGEVVKGVYPEKTALKIKDLKPATMGAIAAELTNDGKREVTELLMLVNPLDYLTKIFPATTVMNANGTYVRDVLPFPTDVEQCKGVTKGKAIVGLPNKYFMGIGSEKKIVQSDEYRLLEDERVYLGKLYGNGFPIDNTSFIVIDISELEAVTLKAPVVDSGTATPGTGTGTTPGGTTPGGSEGPSV